MTTVGQRTTSKSGKGQTCRKTLRLSERPCDVCGERARSHNYGGISCNCCRSFFFKYVLRNMTSYASTNNIKNCKFTGNCKIDKLSRKKCPTCRFFKCVQIGMDPNWVISDYERTQKLKQNKTSQTHPEDVISPQKPNLDDDDIAKIAEIPKLYKSACEQIPYNFLPREKSEILSPTKIRLLQLGMISTAIRRFVCFARMLAEFQRLSLHDQTNLLRRSVMELIILRDVVTYDFETGLSTSEADQYPQFKMDECFSQWSDDMTDAYVQLCRRMRNLATDEESIMLVISVALFSDCGGNENCTEFDDLAGINAAQEHYTTLLQKYLKYLHGDEKGRLIFPRLLSQLAHITQTAQLHQGIPVNMTEDQVNKMHEHLLQIQIIASPSPLPRNGFIHDKTIPLDQLTKEKECCKKNLASKSLLASKAQNPKNPNLAENYKSDHLINSPSLIHTFANHPGEYGIKPYFFESGPHCGIERAFMRRMTELVANPWDSLVSNVSRLSMSPNEDEPCANYI